MGQWATLFVSMKSDEDEKNLKLKSIEKNLIITYASVNFHKCAIKVLNVLQNISGISHAPATFLKDVL